MKRIFTYYFLLFLMSSGLYGQLIPVQGTHNIRKIQSEIYDIDSDYHSSIRPYYFSDIESLSVFDSVSDSFAGGFLTNWETKKKRNIFLHSMPVVNMMAGRENLNEKYIYNIGGGVMFNAGIDNKLGVNSLVTYNYLRPPQSFFISHDSLNTLHSAGFLNGIRNYSNVNNRFTLSYKPYDYLMIETGFGKNFYGDGYRSLLLSKNSYNYPYFKLETQFLDFKYSYIVAQMKNIGSAVSPVYNDLQSKYVVFHYLDWKISRHFSIALFESITMHQDVGFDINYLNPVILLRPVEFYLGSHDNAMMGLNAKLSINSKNIFYGQLAVGDMVVGLLLNDIRRTLNIDFDGEYGWFANKWAIQGGYKSFDLLGINGVNIFTEFNLSRPYMYSHSFHEQNYAHFGQGLAHPLGANFAEFIIGTDYFHNNFNVSIKTMYAHIGADTTGTHYGQDIFKPTMDGPHNPYHVSSYNNVILQGNLTKQLTTWIHFEYLINPDSYLSFNCGVVYRSLRPKYGDNFSNTYIYLGFSSSISAIERLY